MIKNVTPFLKWAGGKRWFGSQLSQITKEISFDRYVEPFLGGGACFFSMQPQSALLSDLNKPLIDCYLAIRKNWKKVYSQLEKYQENHSKEFYYFTRKNDALDFYDAAARFIYLNRTCWNGLYRVNKEGQFNVPIGTKTNVLLPSDDFEYTSEILKRAEIKCTDFESIINNCGEGDLVFADPPYTVKHNQNGFIKYNEKIFSWTDQIRLSNALKGASSRGAHIISTNAAHECIHVLYQDFEQRKLTRNSVISGATTGRGRYEELLILGAGIGNS